MIDYLLTSTFMHAAIILGICFSPVSQVNTSGPIEINIIEKLKFKGMDQKPILSHTPVKPLKSGSGAKSSEKAEKVDMSEYANRLKAAVDPVWVGHVHGLEAHLFKKYTTIVLLFPDKSGNIKSIRVIKGSGDSSLDSLALQTFREVGQIPIPPESLIKEGIEWTFSIGGRN